jgi:hypothetical protein
VANAAAAGAAVGGQHAGRLLLLAVLRGVSGSPVVDWPARLASESLRVGVPLQWQGDLHDEPLQAGVRVAHQLKMGRAGLQAWSARWPEGALASLRLATRAASLIAGMDSMLILAADTTGTGDPAGALVDGESCARMAVAGYDPETEADLGNHAELLGSSGDLVDLPVSATAGSLPVAFLVLGLKLHAPARY